MNDEEKKPTKNRLGNSEAILLVCFAIVCDLLSLIPGINVIVVIISQGLIALFFSMHGVSVLSKKRGVTYAAASIVEFIPVISIIPALTLEVLIMVAITRAEDKAGIKIPGSGATSIVKK